MSARTARKGKSRYKIRNCPEYDASVVTRGNVLIWIDDEAVSGWNSQHDTKRHGRQAVYSDIAIQACMTVLSGKLEFWHS